MLIKHLIGLGVRQELIDEILPVKGADWGAIQAQLIKVLLVVAGHIRDVVVEEEGNRPSHFMVLKAIDKLLGGLAIPQAGAQDVGTVNGLLALLPPGDRGKAPKSTPEKDTSPQSTSGKRKRVKPIPESEEEEEDVDTTPPKRPRKDDERPDEPPSAGASTSAVVV